MPCDTLVDPIIIPRGSPLEVSTYVYDKDDNVIDISGSDWIIKFRVGVKGGATTAEAIGTKVIDDEGVTYVVFRFEHTVTAMWPTYEMAWHIAAYYSGMVVDRQRIRKGILRVDTVIGGAL